MQKPVLFALAWLSLSSAAVAQTPFRSQPFPFHPGMHSAITRGTLRADDGVSYTVTVRAGQRMKASMRTRSASIRFDIIAPSHDKPLFSGSSTRPVFELGKMPVTGVYQVVVYLIEPAVMRDETADYALIIGVMGNP